MGPAGNEGGLAGNEGSLGACNSLIPTPLYINSQSMRAVLYVIYFRVHGYSAQRSR